MDSQLKIEKNPIQVADRLFGILELLAERGEMQLQDIAVEVGLNKTTAHRVLQSLMFLGYVRQEDDGRYSPTLRIAAMADKVVARENLVHIVHPYLQ
jgi:DNA-binding IclR family transcriptional regulator